MDKTKEFFTMDELIGGLGSLQENASGREREVCQTAASILYALMNEGARTTEDALDILHDYRLQAKQNANLRRKYLTAGKPFLKDGVWHCPDCNRRTGQNHSFCHRCGKKLGWPGAAGK